MDESPVLVDVTLRDGLQSLDTVVSTEDKVRIAELLVGAGFRELEVASFVHPKFLPQMADAEEVLKRLPRHGGVRYRTLVPNVYGAKRAVNAGVERMVFVLPVVDALSTVNQNRIVSELIAELDEVIDIADRHGVELLVGLGGAFFVPGYGDVPRERVELLARSICDMGVHEMYVASSFGMAHPQEVVDLIRGLREGCCSNCRFGVHLHNRNGLGLANAVAAISENVSWIEAAMLGLGGDPWLVDGDPDVLGNVPMEDVVHLAELSKLRAGVDLGQCMEASRRISEILGVKSVSHAIRGGTRSKLATASA